MVSLHREVNDAKSIARTERERTAKLEKQALLAQAREQSHRAQRHVDRVPRLMVGTRNMGDARPRPQPLAPRPRTRPTPGSKGQHLLSAPVRRSSFLHRGASSRRWRCAARSHLDSAIILTTRKRSRNNFLERHEVQPGYIPTERTEDIPDTRFAQSEDIPDGGIHVLAGDRCDEGASEVRAGMGEGVGVKVRGA